MRHIRRLCSLSGAWLLVVAQCGLAHAQGEVYLFGGSQLDNGNDAALGYLEPGGDGIHFTNGKTYGEYLPGLLGLGFKSSNGYAYGGATSGTTNIVGTLGGQGPKFLGLQSQISAAAAAGVAFRPADLIAINAAQDDYLNALFTMGATTAPALEAVSGTIAANLGTAVIRLHAMGGDRFIVATPWDYYQSPQHAGFFNQNITPAVTQAVAQTITEMQALHASTHADIVVYNAELAFHQFAADPAAYGFSNVSDGCSTAMGADDCAGGKASTYLFFNGQHPTTYADYIIAEQMANLEQAPAFAATGVRLLAANTELFDQAIRQHLDEVPASSAGLQLFVLGLGGDGTQSTLTDHGGVPAAFGDNYDIAGGAVGVEAQPEPGLTTGILAGATKLSGAANGETLAGHASDVGLFLSYNTGPWRVDGTAAYNWDSYGKISRPGVMLGDLSASPNGHGASITGQVSRSCDLGILIVRPLAGLSYQDTSLDGYSEQGDPLLAQQVGATRIVDFFGNAGAALELPPSATLPLRSAMTLEVQHDFLGSGFTVNSAPLSAPVSRSLQVPDAGRTYGIAELEAAYSLTTTVTVSGNLYSTILRNDGNQHGAWVKIAFAF